VPEAQLHLRRVRDDQHLVGFYGNVKKNAKVALRLAPLPYYPDVPGAPQNTVIGGAACG
jgi:hypothetical protein